MHVIYIHTHDSGRILSPYGYAVDTLNLKKFAEDATIFRQAYCVSPTCSPSRTAMLTGTYPHQNGMLGLAQRGFQIDCKKHLVPFLNKHGFHSVLSGIQHESGWYLDHEKGASTIGYKENLTNDIGNYRQEDLGEWDRKNAQSIVEFLRQYDKKKPLFLSYGLYATHRRYPDVLDSSINVNQVVPPYPIPDTLENRMDHAHYMTSAKGADICIGSVINALKEAQMYDNSIILFTTDHGLANPFSKCTLFDSGLAVSLIMRVPKARMIGGAVDQLVSHIDIFPTLCDLLSIDKPNWLEGSSFANSFQDKDAHTRDEIYGEVNFHTSYEPIRCVRDKRYKYIRYYDTSYLHINVSNIDESIPKDYFMANDLMKQMKYEEALYDTIFDIGERNNLVNVIDYAHIKEQLSNTLEFQMKKTKDPLLDGEMTILKDWKVNKKECLQASSKNPDDYESLGR